VIVSTPDHCHRPRNVCHARWEGNWSTAPADDRGTCADERSCSRFRRP
jgi:hypothetical protein